MPVIPEPHVQRVGKLLVMLGLGTQQVYRIQTEPRFDAVALDALRDLLQQFRRARMQLPGFPVHEKRHRHTPVALARHAPVRTVVDHALQPRAPPGRKKLRRFDSVFRDFPQGCTAALFRLAGMRTFFPDKTIGVCRLR